MKKVIFTIGCLMASVLMASAQQKVIEPEKAWEVVIVNADSSVTKLQKEKFVFKSKSTHFGLIPIPGSELLDKSKSRMIIKGAKAPVSVPHGKITMVVKTVKRKSGEEAKPEFCITQLEVQKKERVYMSMETGIFSGGEVSLDYSNVPYNVVGQGDECFVVTIDDAEPGEYAILMPSGKACTFSVE